MQQSPYLLQAAKPQFADLEYGHLGQIEEFCIGCLSGLVGAGVVIWLGSSSVGGLGHSISHALQWAFYVVLLPSLIAEIWESYVLFASASCNRGMTPIPLLHRVTARKRLARQLFGQGVIMGQAGLDLQHARCLVPFVPEEYAALANITLYASVWLAWIYACHIMDSVPIQDKIAVELQQRTRKGSSKSSSMQSSASSQASSISSTSHSRSSHKSATPTKTPVGNKKSIRRAVSAIPMGVPQRPRASGRPSPPKPSKSSSSTRSTGSTRRVDRNLI